MKNRTSFFKRGLSLLVCLVMCLSMLPGAAHAQETELKCGICQEVFTVQGNGEQGTVICSICGAKRDNSGNWTPGGVLDNGKCIHCRTPLHFVAARETATCTLPAVKAHWTCESGAHNYFNYAGNKPGAIMTGSTVTTPALGHEMTYHPAVDATCSVEGTVEYWSCSRCGDNFRDGGAYTTSVISQVSTSINPNAHSWGSWADNGDGTHTRTCALDNGHTESNHHNYVDNVCTECQAVQVFRYQVVFNSNGGSQVTQQTVTGGQKATEPAAPTREGYDFAGWQLNGAAYNFNAPVTSDITLVAQWTPEQYTVTFDSQGGSEVPAQTVDRGGFIARPAAPTREGYTFAGWYKGTSATTYDFTTPVTGNITLYAKWKQVQTYTVTFVDGGETVATVSVKPGFGVNCPTRTKEGYTFLGWYQGTVEYKPGTPLTGNITLYANWQIKQYNVTWMNGDQIVATATASYGDPIPGFTGTAPTKSVDPADKGTVCSYTLSWETSSTAATVTEDIIYQAVFTSASHHFATGWSSLGSTHGHKCLNGCGEKSDVAPHTYQWELTKEPTAEELGEATGTCTVCGHEVTAAVPYVDSGDPAIWTKVEEKTVPATCVTPGSETYTSIYGEVVVTIPALDHDFAEAWTADGENHWHVCTRCDAVDGTAAHVWDGGVVTTPSTTVAPGVRTYTCTECGRTRTAAIPQLPTTTPTNPTGPVTPGNGGNGPIGGGTTPIDDEDVPLGGGDTVPIDEDEVPLDDGSDIVSIDEDDVPLASGLNLGDRIAYLNGYGDGTVRPANFITRAEVATVFFRLMTDANRAANWADSNAFTDVRTDLWYNEAISTAAKAGILLGYTDGSFKPDNNITRAEFAAIAVRFLSVEVESVTFSDTVGHWAEKEIGIVAGAGWMLGYEDGSFRPNETISRAEAAIVINRMLGRDIADRAADTRTWSDNPETAWYYEDIQEATNGKLR